MKCTRGRESRFLDALAELKGQTRPAQRTLTFKACTRKGALCKLKLMLVPIR